MESLLFAQVEIADALMKECALIPETSLRTACDNLAANFAQIIADLLIQGLQPDVICKYTGILFIVLCTDFHTGYYII